MVKTGITPFGRTPHVRQPATVQRLIAHVPGGQVPSRRGVHRTRISLLFRCPVMTGESDSVPSSRYHGSPGRQCVVGPTMRLTLESARSTQKRLVDCSGFVSHQQRTSLRKRSNIYYSKLPVLADGPLVRSDRVTATSCSELANRPCQSHWVRK